LGPDGRLAPSRPVGRYDMGPPGSDRGGISTGASRPPKPSLPVARFLTKLFLFSRTWVGGGTVKKVSTPYLESRPRRPAHFRAKFQNFFLVNRGDWAISLGKPLGRCHAHSREIPRGGLVGHRAEPYQGVSRIPESPPFEAGLGRRAVLCKTLGAFFILHLVYGQCRWPGGISTAWPMDDAVAEMRKAGIGEGR
jgi:hypothetical protein